METLHHLNAHKNYFEHNDYREEIFRSIFCDFETFPWDGDIESLQKFHDFCQKSEIFADIADYIHFQHSYTDWVEKIIELCTKFLQELQENLKINLPEDKQEQWFNQKEVNYIRKRLFAFVYYPPENVIHHIDTTKLKTAAIFHLQNFKK